MNHFCDIDMAKLFTEFQLNKITLKNRAVMPAMCMYSASADGILTPWHKVHYVTRAQGGIAFIIQEATGVEPRGRITNQDLGIWNENHIPALRDLVDMVHQYGAHIGIQLSHAGRKCQVMEEDIIAPSALVFSDQYATPKEMTIADIQEVVASFRSAAQRALMAGYDFIELHAAHGYLINQFLSPLTNFRCDEYGGSLSNRTRFLAEVIGAVREVWPMEKPLGIRVSAEEYQEEGNHPSDVAEILNIVKHLGIDVVNVSSGGVVLMEVKAFVGYQVGYAETIKKMTGLPVMAGGLLSLPAMVEEVLRNQRADLVFLGRELLRNPYWLLTADGALDKELAWPKQYERSKPRAIGY